MSSPSRSQRVTIVLLTLAGGGCDEAHRSRPQPPPPAALAPRAGPVPILLTDATAAAGIDFRHDAGFDEIGWFYVEEMGSGVAAFDADGDEDVDLYFLTGHVLSAPATASRPVSRFFRNEGAGRFVDATAESGLGDARYAQGTCVADFDNDGDLDLYVTIFDGHNALWRNDGGGRFTDVAIAARATGTAGGVDGACAFADVDNDGHVDLWIGSSVDHTREKNVVCHRPGSVEAGSPERIYCPPRTYSPQPDLLLRNRGDGTFEDVTATAGLSTLSGRTLGGAFADYDDDGDIDLFVSNDNTPNFLLINDGTGCFTDVGTAANVAFGDRGEQMSGMGTSSGDFDRDGRIDIVVSYFEREPNALYRNLGGLEFENLARTSGTGAASWPLLAWGTALPDLDLDGLPDWVVVNGHTQPHGRGIAGYRQPMLVFLNRGERKFESLGAAAGDVVVQPRSGRGLACADIDDDGDIDLVLNNLQEPAEVVRNDSPRDGRNWVRLKLVGTGSNRAAIGARVTLQAGGLRQMAEVVSGQSYYSHSDLRPHFGLGAAATIDWLEVRWPSGERSRIEQLAANRQIVLTEGGVGAVDDR